MAWITRKLFLSALLLVSQCHCASISPRDIANCPAPKSPWRIIKLELAEHQQLNTAVGQTLHDRQLSFTATGDFGPYECKSWLVWGPFKEQHEQGQWSDWTGGCRTLSGPTPEPELWFKFTSPYFYESGWSDGESVPPAPFHIELQLRNWPGDNKGCVQDLNKADFYLDSTISCLARRAPFMPEAMCWKDTFVVDKRPSSG